MFLEGTAMRAGKTNPQDSMRSVFLTTGKVDESECTIGKRLHFNTTRMDAILPTLARETMARRPLSMTKVFALTATIIIGLLSMPPAQAAGKADTAAAAQLLKAPLRFEPNRGQSP